MQGALFGIVVCLSVYIVFLCSERQTGCGRGISSFWEKVVRFCIFRIIHIEIIKNIITNLNITGGALGLDTSSIYAGAKDLLPYGAVLVLLTVAVMLNLKRSKYGRAIMAIRDNRIAAESVGLNVTWYKLAVFVIAAFFAGCAGVLYGHSLANIKAAAFDYNMSIEILVIVVLGGMGSVPGSVISAIVLTVLPEALREVADYRMLVYAIVLILVMQATNNPTMKRFFASAKEKLTPGRKERAAL